MIYLLLSSLIVFSPLSISQTRTGSGGVNHEPDESVLPPSEGSLSGIKSQSLEEKLIFLTKTFENQDIKCRSEGQRFLELKEKDFMKLYLKLSVLKSTLITENKCQDLNLYFKCLYTPQLKSELFETLKNKAMKKHLQNKYKIDKKEARELIKFFKDLDHSCENHDCKM